MEDIVFPHNNEEEILEMGKKLGIDSFVFVYDSVPQRRFPALMIPKSKLSFFSSRNSLKKNALVYGLFETSMKIDQVVCKIAVQNEVTILFPFATLLSKKIHEQAELLGKWSFALRLFRKYKVKVRTVSLASSPFELRSEQQLNAVLKWLESR